MDELKKNNPLGYMPQLDGLRVTAVFWVMIAHYTESQTYGVYLLYLAHFGVTLFFVLSGFLIAQILMISRSTGQSLLQFYARRVLRIFPLYFFVLFMAYAFNIPECRKYLPYLITYTSNFITAYTQGDTGYMSHLWSLAVEEQFYVFFPFLILLVPKRHYLKSFFAIAFLALVSRVWVYFFTADNVKTLWLSYMLTPCCLDSFAIGAILAYLRINQPERMNKILKNNILFILCALLCVIPALPGVYPLLRFVILRTAFSICCFWAIGKASSGSINGIAGRFLNSRIIIYLGKISYGLYIYHQFMPWIFDHLPKFRHASFFYFPATIALASLSWYLLELPVNRLKKYFKYETTVSSKTTP
jgi:peptidoglycan/LPS O-acetylase OafA/YrhL